MWFHVFEVNRPFFTGGQQGLQQNNSPTMPSCLSLGINSFDIMIGNSWIPQGFPASLHILFEGVINYKFEQFSYLQV